MANGAAGAAAQATAPLSGEIDIHTHPAPDSQEPSAEGKIDYAGQVRQHGMRGFVLRQEPATR